MKKRSPYKFKCTNCTLCNRQIKKEELLFENDLAYASIDSYPVSKFHSLIVTKRHVENYFDSSLWNGLSMHEKFRTGIRHINCPRMLFHALQSKENFCDQLGSNMKATPDLDVGHIEL